MKCITSANLIAKCKSCVFNNKTSSRQNYALE